MRLFSLVLVFAVAAAACTGEPRPSSIRPSLEPSRTDRSTPSKGDPEAARSCEPPILDAGGPSVTVFLADKNLTMPGDPKHYSPATRPISLQRARTPIRAALTELFSGVTPTERRGPCVGIFERKNRDLLLSLDLEGSRLVVDLKDLNREGLGNVSASHAGSVFLTQILLTLGQFPEVDSVLFRMEGSCEDFYEFIQVGECMDLDVRRSGSS